MVWSLLINLNLEVARFPIPISTKGKANWIEYVSHTNPMNSYEDKYIQPQGHETISSPNMIPTFPLVCAYQLAKQPMNS